MSRKTRYSGYAQEMNKKVVAKNASAIAASFVEIPSLEIRRVSATTEISRDFN